MDFDPYDFKKLQELLDKNKNFLESFFGHNPFDQSFFKKAIQKDNVLGESNTANTADNQAVTDNKAIPVDIVFRKHELLLVFEIPGLSKVEDVNIKILGSTIVIEGEIRRNYITAEKEQTKFERKIGRFSRKVAIPVVFDSKRIRARYSHGLLEVRIPILKQNHQETITVNFSKNGE